MYKNSALLSIGAAVVFSLFFFGVGHAFQIEKRQGVRILTAAEMKGTANLSINQVSHAPNPCTVGGRGRTGAPGKQRCSLESEAMATAGSRYTSHVSNTAHPCGGRTGAPCTRQSPPGSGEAATDRSLLSGGSMLVPLPLVGILFGAGFIVLVGLGVRGWRHNHEHHDGHHA